MDNPDFWMTDSESDFEGFEQGEQGEQGEESDDSSDDGNGEIVGPADYIPALHQTDWTGVNLQPVVTEDFDDSDSGPKLPEGFDRNSGPLEYFQLFFPDEFILKIVENTNSYADWYREHKLLRNPRWEDKLWPDTGELETGLEEMKAYFGLMILFGVNPMPQYKDYWSANIFIGNEGAKRTMSLKRYEKLTQYFHVADRYAEPGRQSPNYNKNFKVQAVIDQVQTQSYALYEPNEHQAIDEGEVLHKMLFCQ